MFFINRLHFVELLTRNLNASWPLLIFPWHRVSRQSAQKQRYHSETQRCAAARGRLVVVRFTRGKRATGTRNPATTTPSVWRRTKAGWERWRIWWKGIEQELNHVFHTIGSENGARDTGEPSGGFQSVGWNWKWTAAPSPFWQPRVNKSQFPSIASRRWPQKYFCQRRSGRRTANIVPTCSKWWLRLRPGAVKKINNV